MFIPTYAPTSQSTRKHADPWKAASSALHPASGGFGSSEALFMTKRGHGVQARRAAGGKIACQPGGEQQNQRDRAERDGIGRSDPVQQAAQRSGNCNGSAQSGEKPDQHGLHAIRKYRSQDVASHRSKGNPKSDV